jgi:hypothetical protein
VSLLGVVAIERAELRRCQSGMAARGELCAIDLEERTGQRVEAEGVAFLDDDAGGLAPDFDDEGFGHGWISLVSLDMVSIRRFDNGRDCRSWPDTKQSLFMRRQCGDEFFCTDVENTARNVTSR